MQEHLIKQPVIVVILLLCGMLPTYAAEAWICTFPGLISKMTVRERMEIGTNDVIRDGELAYRIVENDNRGIIATHARTQPAQNPMIAGTLAIDKSNGEFVISVMVPGQPLANKVVTGKCKKE
jgi:hypothetical protein